MMKVGWLEGVSLWPDREPTEMSRETFATRQNLDLLEDSYQRWKADPNSVDGYWQAFFEGLELSGFVPVAKITGDESQTAVVRLIFAYRDLGHFLAHLDPLTPPPATHPLLELSQFGLSESDLDREFDTSAFHGTPRATLRDLITILKETYCRTIGYEFSHIQDINVRAWIRERIEPRRSRPNMVRRQRLRVLMNLHYAELFEKFLHTRYVGQKRFSLEGAETLIPILDALVEKGPELGVQEFILGMAHRGRLNVLANTLHKPYQEIFAEFEDNFSPDSIDGDGDVKYHLGFSSDVQTSSGKTVHLSLTPNPSHLEAVNPVVEGRTRAKQRLFHDTDRGRGVPVLIHGDAAFAGQGIVAETLNLSQLSGYRTGGTVHIIVNNQIGFTTSPNDARSTTYCTDVAKMIQAPIFHVNAEDPEAAVFITELALEFRQTFRRDVLIDLYCYRRHGHNEGDEPAFTQPLMYRKIRERSTIATLYTEQLVRDNTLTSDEAKGIDEEFQSKLQSAQVDVRTSTPRQRGMLSFTGNWSGMEHRYTFRPVQTGVPRESLAKIIQKMTTVPEGMSVDAKMARILETRFKDFNDKNALDWATAELLSFGSLVLEGTHVRLSGQDSRRGTFSQRHSVIYDNVSGERYIPFNAFEPPAPATFAVYDSLLSENAVLGFEFGYTMDDPSSLVLWEAQFGDFLNGAQTVIDQFITCSESKWQRSSGLVMLLPHGYEGQGPEHSSGRVERFLQACAEDNIQVCNLTTPAQYFHVLRRQMKRNFRKPLIIMTPKSLLRHKDAVSPVDQLVTGAFQEILDDATVDASGVRRVLLCSGKVYYDLADKRNELGAKDVAIIRLEQLYPFAEDSLRAILNRFREAHELVWVQEESQNMGAWTFVEPRIRAMGHDVQYVGRDASASPATGSLKVHNREQKELVAAAFEQPVPYLVRSHQAAGMRPKPDPVVKDSAPAALSPAK